MTQNVYIIENFLELVKTNVQSRNERAIADLLKQKLTGLGCEVTEDGVGQLINGNTGNIIARLKGDDTAPAILLSAHMDRVKKGENIKPIVSENKITSDGSTILAADDVAGIAAILDGVRKVKEANVPHGDIEIVFSVCEEQGVLGSRYLDFACLKAKLAYVFDSPGSVGRIVNQAPSKSKIKVQVHGRSAHAGNEPEKGLNAIKVAAAALVQVEDGRINESLTANYGIIQGGGSINVVCDYVEILGEVRSTATAEMRQYIDNIKQTFAAVAQQYGTTIDVEVEELYETFYVETEEVVAQIAKRALQSVGADVRFTPGGGGMDANNFNKAGIRAIGLASGYSKNHTLNEEVSIPDLIKSGDLVKELVSEVYKLNK
jgi:tripeptide aminopeptidase